MNPSSADSLESDIKIVSSRRMVRGGAGEEFFVAVPRHERLDVGKVAAAGTS